MSDFVLRSLVTEILKASTITDPGLIADEVYKRIAARERPDALKQALRQFVRQVISEQRSAHAPGTPAPSSGSWKVREIRDGWQRRLRDRVHVGDAQWKFLGQCTADDLRAAAAERQQLADRNSAWARQYRAWADLVDDSSAATFADLPAEVLMNALGAAA